MTRKRREWSSEETKELYNALDESAKEGLTSLGQSVAKIEQRLLMILEEGKSQLSEKQIKTKLHGLGKKVGVNAEKLVSEWRRHRQQFVAKGHQRQRASQSPRASSLQTGNSTPPQNPEQPPDKPPSPATDDPPAPAADNPTSPTGAGPSNGPPAASPQEINNSFRRPHDDVRDLLEEADVPGYVSLDQALEQAWALSSQSRDYGWSLCSIDAGHAFAEVTVRIQDGITSFCEGFPIAHLTASNLTRASLGLGRQLCMLHDRDYVESTLKALLADPFMTTQTVLRAFAAAAVCDWVFGFPERSERQNTIKKPLDGNLLKFFEKYLPQFASAMEKEETLTYLETVTKPMIPGLARQFQSDLFDALSSLCVPPAPPPSIIQWQHSTPEAQAAAEGGLLAYRRGHQMNFQRHLEEAFLAALKFNMKMRMCPPECSFSLKYPKIGEPFDKEWMIAADARADAQKLTADNKVALGLCPAILKSDGPSHGRYHIYILQALVMVEGFGLDETLRGYPLVLDAPA